MSLQVEAISLSSLQRPSGAFSMLAIDQRETLRAMLAEVQSGAVLDSDLVAFKLEALRALSPIASAVLIDQEFGWRPALAEGAVSSTCALIAAYDRFTASKDELVADVEIDGRTDPAVLRAQGAKALKLLVIWRPDGSAQKRIAMVDDFVGRCKAAGLVSIIEPVSRRAGDGSETDIQAGILAAAKELGNRGQDLYKSELPMYGMGSDLEIRRQCAELGKHIGSPWVILSSGVSPDLFPKALELACREGASGFLAGRAIWKNSIYTSDIAHALKTDATERLKRLCDIADRVVAG